MAECAGQLPLRPDYPRVERVQIWQYPRKQDPSCCLSRKFYSKRMKYRQLNYVIKQYQDYHNYLRPHQGNDIGNRVLDPDAKPQPITGIVKRKKILGGLLNHDYREAA
ncbi:MAG: hypothetical protein JXR97_14750 [Planctomycetes bacterium]|nr:hypothetical protein [Planctomycetota bacterium]